MVDVIKIVDQPTIIKIVQSPPDTIKIVQSGGAGSAASGIAIVSALAGASIMSFQAVVLISGLIYPADPTNPVHATQVAGIAITSVSAGNVVTFSAYGQIAGFPSNLTTGLQYYIGASGILSSSPTFVGAVWKKFVGIALSPSILVHAPDPTIEIA